MTGTRTERDSLGELQIASEQLWGIHTQRAITNFDASGVPLSAHPDLVEALVSVKRAAAQANKRVGALAPDVADAIDLACQAVLGGAHRESFCVDVVQGGAGTSTNMNANEVIANLALKSLGLPAGSYDVVHPNDHVNRSQSTNDVYPTAVKLALVRATERLLVELDGLSAAFEAQSDRHRSALKMGRTQLQDAVPMTVGLEFSAFAVTIAEDRQRLQEVIPLLCEVNLGGTAIGTGITAPPGYRAAVVSRLIAISGLPLVSATHLVEATSDTGVFLTLSGALKRCAMKLSKVCNDLRLLSSGPQSGFGELRLPPRQAGSSLMPGKVNPVIPEMVNQVAFAVAGADTTVTMAVEAGQLQLNAFEPIIAHSLLQMLSWMSRACRALADRCVNGIEVDVTYLRAMVERSTGVVTALTPHIGYAAAATLAKEALRSGRRVIDIAVESGALDPDTARGLLSPMSLVPAAASTDAAILDEGVSPC